LVVLHFGGLNRFAVSMNFVLFTTMKVLHAFDVGKNVLVFKLSSAERSVLEENPASGLAIGDRPGEQVFGGWLEDFLHN
jgi:hypothetical protein